MHIYSLGTPRSSTCITGVVSGTFFESLEGTSVDATSGEGLSPKDWLQWKQQYQAAWFSYEYYDKKEPERREEECQEKVRIGEQNIVVSPDVVHRVWFFVNGFLKSLEAVPLVSQGKLADQIDIFVPCYSSLYVLVNCLYICASNLVSSGDLYESFYNQHFNIFIGH